MTQQPLSSIENNFTKGLITEFTGLNFPENAATDTDNCEYSLIGDVNRRRGIDYETNGSFLTYNRANRAISSYKWNNVGGDGNIQLVVEQIGPTLFFYKSSSATASLPLSRQYISSTYIDLNSFRVTGTTLDETLECQYTDGNGYLFVFHPGCDPFYCIYDPITFSVTGSPITVKTRDFTGMPEVGSPVNFRPPTLNDVHNYNLLNQGWQSARLWTATSTTFPTLFNNGGNWAIQTGAQNFTIQAGVVGIVNGQFVNISGHLVFDRTSDHFKIDATTNIFAQVTGYAGTTLSVTILSGSISPAGFTAASFTAFSANLNLAVSPTANQITSWFSAIGNYPSNADVWWIYKNSSGVFAPATTIANFPPPTTPAAKGFFILDEFNQQRDTISSITTLTDIATNVRPRTGTWFQGRVWYTGCDASVNISGNASAYSWTENIYFSQIVTTTDDFGHCYQTNDPTSETLFDLLPTDGGVIKIQGCGSIYKLFPIQNGMLVFAANGIWIITGSQGQGFSATDYRVDRLATIRSISSTSFVDVLGLPYFWNEEGIYNIQPTSTQAYPGSLTVNPITVGTIQSFFDEIPAASKKYVRGVYDPIAYRIQWIYKATPETDVTSRYSYDSILNYNTHNQAFYPYSITSFSGNSKIIGISYVSYPGVANAPSPGIKYYASGGVTLFNFADEHDTNYIDFASDSGGASFDSHFITGYKLHGKGQTRFQLGYLYMYSRNDVPTNYKIQGIWDYAATDNSNRWSTAQIVNNWSPNFGMVIRRHKIRGQGLVLQLKVSSVTGKPFDIMGWSAYETVNTGQ